MDQGAMDDTAKMRQSIYLLSLHSLHPIEFFWYRLTVSFTYEEILIITLST